MSKRKGSSRKERTSEIGEYLTYLRVSQGKTQQEIAARISSGTGKFRGKSFICRIETGQRAQQSLRGFILYQIAEAYRAPIAEILKKANWTQLLLLDTTEEERQQLMRHLKRIRRRKKQQNPSSS